jgi:dipeptidyl aminopeptidase/acylaminoacyl peptidase
LLFSQRYSQTHKSPSDYTKIENRETGKETDMKQLQLDDFYKYKFISELSFSPDGSKAAVVIAESDAEKNEYRTAVWLYRNDAWTKLTGLNKERNYLWEDDTHILFPAVRTDEEREKAKGGDVFTSYYRIDTEGGEAEWAFTLPFGGSLKERIDADRWIVCGSFDADVPDYYRMTKEEREKIGKEKKENADYEILTEIPFYENGEGFTDRKRGGIFLFDTQSGEAERINDASVSARSLVLKDGMIYYMGAEENPVRFHASDELYVYHIETKETNKLTANDCGLKITSLEKLGEKLVVIAEEASTYQIGREPSFYIVDIETGAFTLLRAEDESLMNSTGSDCRYGATHKFRTKNDGLYYLKTVRNDVHLCRLNADGSAAELVTKAGAIDDFDVTKDGKICLVALYDNRLQEVYTAGRELCKISAFNDAALEDTYVADYHKMTVSSCGWDIDGWVLYPKDYDERKQYPAILDIHGGPRTVYGEIFYHEMQVWANMGYFVFFCNPVGGSGRGWKFADITDAYGKTDFHNIMDFTDAVLAAYPQIDPKRVGCTGGSYGGFMSNWIMGHTDRFSAIATQRSISNWISFYGVSDIGYFFVKNQLGHDLYHEEGLKRMWDMSPLKYINRMRTPTLFIHSDEDYRCPMEQGLQLFTALKEKGVPTRFVYFKGENHELSRSGKPQHRKKRLSEITDWMTKYLM